MTDLLDSSSVPPVEPAPSPEQVWHDAWSAALREVELDVDAAEALIAAMHSGSEDEPAPAATNDFVDPSVLGPMPREFADRARVLLQRQLDVGQRLSEAMWQSRTQRRGLNKLSDAERRPVFLDQAL